jgi:hypothetical protein
MPREGVRTLNRSRVVLVSSAIVIAASTCVVSVVSVVSVVDPLLRQRPASAAGSSAGIIQTGNSFWTGHAVEGCVVGVVKACGWCLCLCDMRTPGR